MKHLILFTTLHDQLGARLKGIFGNDAEGELAQLFAPNSISGSLLSQLERVNNEEEINEPPNVRLFIGDILGGPLSPLLQGFETQFTFPFPLFPPLNLVQQLRN